MSKVNVKQIHALVDELADAGQGEMLTALHLIMMQVARASADDSDLDLDDDEKPAKTRGSKSKKVRGKVRGKKAVAEDDEEDEDDADDADDGEDDGDEDDLDGLDGLDSLDVDGDDDKKSRKSSKKVRGKKAAADEDDDDDADDADDDGDDEAGEAPEWTPGKKVVATFEKFLDEVDNFEFEANSSGVRELNAAIQSYGINPNDMDFDLGNLEGRELRKAKQEAFGTFLTQLEHVEEALVEAGEDALEKLADHYEVDTDEIKGRGKAKLQKIAAAIVGAVYAPEE
jgi:hypothetical protein